MKTFTPIAMRCTKKQFKAINPKLKGLYRQESEFEFIDYPYLTNDYNKEKLCIGTWDNSFFAKDTKVYEVWNEEIFLNACGIEPTYTITKEQLTYLHSVESIKETIEEWFPNEFPKIQCNRWIKDDSVPKWLIYTEDGFNWYGFDINGNWKAGKCGYSLLKDKCNRYATEQEVSEALIAEAKKRGFKSGVKIKNLFKGTIDKICNDIFQFRPEWVGNKNILFLNNYCIFKDGVWAEIISEPIEVTLEERVKRIEEQLKMLNND